ncbi:hypothetical protein [aff. Roholtiella sp. LEGE 12411]|nr:hypothetical protein [aff. Roholtiella sp. LEGE 12411]
MAKVENSLLRNQPDDGVTIIIPRQLVSDRSLIKRTNESTIA